MKKIALTMVCILLAVSVTNASDLHKNKWNCDAPISFTERGIEFFVSPNGDFHFNTHPKFCQTNYKASQRNGVVIQVNKSINYGMPIEHDAFGRIKKVGNVFINYDKQNRVNRIGNVYMKYNHFTR
ncbi:MAG: hypothetical protein ACI7YS_14555 [Flavobacterium sp.]